MPQAATTTNRQLSDKLDTLISQNNDLRVEIRERLAILETQMENNQSINNLRFKELEKKQTKSEKVAYGILMTFVGVLIYAFMTSIGVTW